MVFEVTALGGVNRNRKHLPGCDILMESTSLTYHVPAGRNMNAGKKWPEAYLALLSLSHWGTFSSHLFNSGLCKVRGPGP